MALLPSRAAPWSGVFFVLLAALCWAFIGPIGKYVLEQGASPLEVAFWRATFGAMLFWMHGLRQGLIAVPPRVALAFMLFGIVGIGGLFGVYLTAVHQAGAALASVLLYTAPAWVALLSRLIYKETVTPAKTAAVLLAVGGAALACFSGGGLPQGASTFGMLMGLTAGLLYASHYIFGAFYLRTFSPVSLYCWALPAGALALLVFADFTEKSLSAWLALAAMGLICTYSAFWTYGEGLKRLPPTTAAVLSSLEPILTALLAWWWWDEMFSVTGWIGAFMVLAAVLLVIAGGNKTAEPA